MVYVDPREDPAFVDSPAELDLLLDCLTMDPQWQHALPLVEIVTLDEHRVLDIGVTHPELSIMCWYDHDANEALGAVGTHQATPPVAFQLGGVWTEPYHHAVPIGVARQAAREFATTGARPTAVSWQPLPQAPPVSHR